MGQNSITDDNQQSNRLYKQRQSIENPFRIIYPESNIYSRYSGTLQNKPLKTFEATSPIHQEDGTLRPVQRRLNFGGTEPAQNFGYSIDTERAGIESPYSERTRYTDQGYNNQSHSTDYSESLNSSGKSIAGKYLKNLKSGERRYDFIKKYIKKKRGYI